MAAGTNGPFGGKDFEILFLERTRLTLSGISFVIFLAAR
jgi:hypothetical protein